MIVRNSKTYTRKEFKKSHTGVPCYEIYEDGRLFGFAVGDYEADRLIDEHVRGRQNDETNIQY